jgi:hypothetical protein
MATNPDGALGGAYQPKTDYDRTGATDSNGTYATATLTSATLTGTTSIGAGATLTSPTLTNPVINGASGVGNVVLYAADGAVSLASQIGIITKAGSACLLSVAAPGASGVGLRITLTSNSAFAHVITFTGATLRDGVTGSKTTVTMTAFAGSSLTVVGASATIWLVESVNVLTSIA